MSESELETRTLMKNSEPEMSKPRWWQWGWRGKEIFERYQYVESTEIRSQLDVERRERKKKKKIATRILVWVTMWRV